MLFISIIIIIGIILFIVLMAMGGTLCGDNSNTDVGSYCYTTPDCPKGLYCCNNKCLCIEQTSCKTDSDCISGLYCFGGICVNNQDVELTDMTGNIFVNSNENSDSSSFGSFDPNEKF